MLMASERLRSLLWRRLRGVSGIALRLGLAAGLFLVVAPPAQGASRCVRVHLGKRINFPNGLQSLPAGGFLVASPWEGTLTRFAADGSVVWSRHGEPEPPADFTRPASITRAPGADRILFDEAHATFFIADLEGTIVAKHSITRDAARRDARVDLFSPPYLLPGDRIAVLARTTPLGAGPESRTSGLFIVGLEDGSWQGPFATWDDFSELSYLTDDRLLAATPSGLVVFFTRTPYELRWVEEGKVRTVPLQLDGLEPFPKGLQLRPNHLWASFYSALAARRLPLGVYWDRAEVFVLVASPLAGGAGRRWELVAVDPVSGRAKRSLRLPTEADEVKISPGDEEWIVLERTIPRVEGFLVWGESALRIPAAWFHQEDSPLLVETTAPTPQCESGGSPP